MMGRWEAARPLLKPHSFQQALQQSEPCSSTGPHHVLVVAGEKQHSDAHNVLLRKLPTVWPICLQWQAQSRSGYGVACHPGCLCTADVLLWAWAGCTPHLEHKTILPWHHRPHKHAVQDLVILLSVG